MCTCVCESEYVSIVGINLPYFIRAFFFFRRLPRYEVHTSIFYIPLVVFFLTFFVVFVALPLFDL